MHSLSSSPMQGPLDVHVLDAFQNRLAQSEFWSLPTTHIVDWPSDPGGFHFQGSGATFTVHEPNRSRTVFFRCPLPPTVPVLKRAIFALDTAIPQFSLSGNTLLTPWLPPRNEAPRSRGLLGSLVLIVARMDERVCPWYSQ